MLKRTPLRKKSKSPTALCKERIQALLREIVIKRDGGCILRHIRRCGGELGQAVFQADHLLPRSNSATYSDHRLVVCVCRNCHGWKHWWKEEYDALIKTIISKERVILWERAEQERLAHKPHKMDWAMEILGLKQELKKYARKQTTYR